MFELELLNSLLIWSDGSALDSNLTSSDGVGSIDGHLIVGGVSVLNGEVEVLGIKVNIWVDVLQGHELAKNGLKHLPFP